MTAIPVVPGGEQDTPQRPAAPPVPARVPSVAPSVAAPPTRSAASTPDAVSTVRRAAYASDTSPSEARKFAHLAALKSLHPRAVEAVSKAGQPGDMDVLEADLSSLEAATTMRNWLARPGNAAVARDDIGTLALMENHLRRAERGWLGEMGAATGAGFDQLQGSYHHLRALFGVDVDAAYAGIAENTRQVQRSQQGRSLSTQAYFQRLEHASGLGIIGAAFASPSKLPVLLAENFAFSVPARAAGFAGGLVSPVPGGSIAGMAAGGTLTEMGAYMQEAFTARGYDMADPASVRKAYSDPELVATLKAEAFRKGIGVAAVDALSVFFAGRQVAKAAGFGARARAFGVELVEQGVGEGAGEAVGQGFAHLDLSAIDWDDVVLESVAGLGQSAAEISLGAAYRRATAPLRAQTDATVRAAQDHEAIRAAVEAARKSNLAQELPEKAIEAADAILDGMDPEMRVARVPREAFDALAAAEGKSPSAWAEEIDPGGGAVAYGTSVLTGQVEIPTAALIVAASKIQGSDALLESARFRPDGMSVADVKAMTEDGAQAEQAARAASATFYQEEQPLRARAAEIDAALAATPEQAQGVAADLAAVLGPDTEAAAGLVEEAAAAGGVQDADLAALLPEGTVLDAALAGQALAEAQTDPAGFAERLRGAARAAQVSDVAARTALETERAQIQVQLEAFDAERQTDQVVAQDLSTRVAAELEATGKFKAKTAAMMGRFYSRAYEVLAQRSGVPLRKFIERFPVTFGKGDGSRSARALFQTAFHGSPHRFDKFDISKIGTGEGAQAYGWGLYFTETKDVADFYKKALSQVTSADQISWADEWARKNADLYWRLSESAKALGYGKSFGDVDGFAVNLLAIAGVAPRGAASTSLLFHNKLSDSLRGSITRTLGEAGAPPAYPQSGALFTVDLAPAEDEYLLWDKPLSEQSEKVKAAMEGMDEAASPFSNLDLLDAFLASDVAASFPDTQEVRTAKRVRKEGKEEIDEWAATQRRIKGMAFNLFAADTGAALYGRMAARHEVPGNPMRSQEAASRALLAAGIPGIKYLDGSSRSAGEGSYNYVLFDDSLVNVLKVEQKKRGAATITKSAAGIAFDIQFFGRANRSTFFHETGHIFLEILADISQITGEGSQHASDFAEVLDWFGVQSREEITTKHHEQFARGFEAYIRTGDAPSAGLRRLFSAFRAWMVRIYQDMRRLNVTLTPGVTRVMDRILATDAEIAAAEYESGTIDAIPQDVLDALPEDEREAYVAALEEARATAREQLQRKVETDLQRTKRQRAEAEAGVRADVTAYLMRDPAMIAVRHMMEGKTPEGADVPKGSRVQIAPEAIERLPQRRQDALRAMGIVAAPGEGYGLAQIAEMFGFQTESEAINGILAVRSGTEKVIDRLTKRRLQQDFPDLLSRAEVKAIARRDVANDALARLLKRENDALRKRMSEERQDAANERRAAFAPGLKITEIRFLAARILAPMRVSEIRPRAYLSAVGRERTAMAKALRAGNIQEAAAASDRARMNLELFRIADGLVRRATRDTAYLRRTQRKTVRERLVRASTTEPGETYAEQVNAIVESTGVLPVPKSGPVLRTESLADFVASQAARGIPIDIPPHLALDDRNRLDARRMTAAELHTTRNAVEQIVQVATDADKMLTGDRKRKRSELARAAEVAVRESRPARPEVVGAPTRKERFVAFWQGWFDNGTRASIFARMMDSERDGGPVQTALVRPINDATDATAILHRQNADRLSALYTEHYTADELARMDEREDFGGVALSREDRLSILGHYGSITGRQRLSILLTADQLAAVLGSFTESDMAFAAARAAFFNELKALDDAVMARATGAKPPPLELAPFTVVTTSGKEITAPGWYMPVDYKRGTGKAFLAAKADTPTVDAAGRSPASLLPGGFRKGRVNVFDGKLDLSREVVLRHVRDVTTSIGMRDAVMDVQAILSDRELRRALVEHYGASVLGELDGWIRRVASDSNHPSSALEQGLATMRRRAVMSRLAFRLFVGVKQILGLRLTVMRVGARETWEASRQYLGSHAKMTAIGDWIAEKSAFMRERPTGTRYRELNEMLAAGSKVSTVEQMVTNSGFWFVIRGQLIADRVTWLAQYNKSMARAPQGLDEAGLALMDKQAVADADQAVKDSQSGGQPVDQSYWEGGGPLVRLLTTYGTEMGLKFNMTRLVSARTDWRDPVSVAYALGSLGAIYAFEAGLAAITLGLTFDDDEEDESRLAAMSEKFAREVAGAALDTMPILREFSGAARGYGPPRPSPAFAVVGDTYYAAQQLAQVASPTEGTSRSDQLDSALARAINRVAGSSLGLPALALEEVVDAFGQIMDGNLPTALVGFKDR